VCLEQLCASQEADIYFLWCCGRHYQVFSVVNNLSESIVHAVIFVMYKTSSREVHASQEFKNRKFQDTHRKLKTLYFATSIKRATLSLFIHFDVSLNNERQQQSSFLFEMRC